MPTTVEAVLLSRVKPMQSLVIVQASNRPPALRPAAVQSHGMTFANADPDVLLQAVPMNAADVCKHMTVMFIDVCKDRAHLERMVEQAKALEVSGATHAENI